MVVLWHLTKDPLSFQPSNEHMTWDACEQARRHGLPSSQGTLFAFTLDPSFAIGEIFNTFVTRDGLVSLEVPDGECIMGSWMPVEVLIPRASLVRVIGRYTPGMCKSCKRGEGYTFNQAWFMDGMCRRHTAYWDYGVEGMWDYTRMTDSGKFLDVDCTII